MPVKPQRSAAPNATRRGIVDGVSGEFIVGWAVEGKTMPAPPRLFLFVDQTLVANVVCDGDRPDLAALGYACATPGFRIRIPVRLFDDAEHALCLRFDSGEYVPFFVADGLVQLSLRLTPPVNLVSYIDGLNQGRLRGWALKRPLGSDVVHGSLDIRVRHAGREIAILKANRARSDVAAAIGADPSCGFEYLPPPRFRTGDAFTFDFEDVASGQALHGSPHTFQFPAQQHHAQIARLFAATESIGIELFRLKRQVVDLLAANVVHLADYADWVTAYQNDLRRRVARSAWPAGTPRPKVSILCPVFRPRPAELRAAIASVLAQTWRDIELILVDDASKSVEITRLLREFEAGDARVRLIVSPRNVGISAATNLALAAATGEFTAFFDHDDLLLDVAVETMMQAARLSGAALLYSDEDKVDEHGRFSEPNLKPAWNARLLLGQNYVCHFLVARTALLREAGPLEPRFDGAQDHDLILRLAERLPAAQIVHVPEIVYHWRKTPGSTASSSTAKTYAVKAGAGAVAAHLDRRGLSATVAPLRATTLYRIDWHFSAEPRVAVIIPFREQVDMTRRCLDALLATTRYPALDVILVDNWSTSPEARAFSRKAAARPSVTVLRIEEPFNFSRLNNIASARSKAEFFVFMNNDVVVEQPLWLREMVDEALADPAVAVVGPRLLYPDRTTQHGGVILGIGGIADHAYRHRKEDDAHYAGRGICAQELSAVTAALMLCRASAFLAVGGFEEEGLAVAYNDVDLCLRLHEAGHKIVFLPQVIAEHHESLSRGDDLADERVGRFTAEEGFMLDRWGSRIKQDAFYNPNFSPDQGIFEQLAPPLPDAAATIRWRPGGSGPATPAAIAPAPALPRALPASLPHHTPKPKRAPKPRAQGGG